MYDYYFEKRLAQRVNSCVSYLALFSSLIIIGPNCKIDRGYAFTAYITAGEIYLNALLSSLQDRKLLTNLRTLVTDWVYRIF